MARTITGNSPEREQRIISLMLDRLGQRYERRISREIARAMRASSRLVRDGGSPDYVIPEHKQRTDKILKAYWADSAAMIYRHLWGGNKSMFAPLRKKEQHIEPTITADQIMADFVRRFGGEKITQITDTTLDDIRGVVSSGIKAGLTEKEIAREINKIAPTKSASRAQTIARTEGHAAAMFAATESAEATGLQMQREWVSAQGERTREAHNAAHGQTVGMNEAFTVGGEQLMYPGDPSGSAGNVINCRCAVVFVPID